jgi:hypothetical protein
MVTTSPLDGVLGLTMSEVVLLAAHAAGPVTNASALSNAGIQRRCETGLEVGKRLDVTGVCVMGFNAPIRNN